MSEIKQNSIVQVVSGNETAFIGCCVQVREVGLLQVLGDIAYPVDKGEPCNLIEVKLQLSDVKYIGESHLKPI